LELQDFELNVRAAPDGEYVVSVDRSPGGETKRLMRMPYDGLALENMLQKLQIALLSNVPGRRRISTDAESVVQNFGQALFDALFADEVRNVFDVSRARAAQDGDGLRIRLSFDTGVLAGLPWEYMFDERSGDFVGLSEGTPIVRYLRIGQPPRPLAVDPPLRMLGLIASPADRAALDTAAERERLENALQDLRATNRVELHWAEGESWRALQHELRKGPWHLFHFVGHGGFDTALGEGVIALVDDTGRSELVSATNLGRLLGDHQPMRLAVLNACEGARADDTDIFSSVATTLVRKGTPAVVGMQYEITDTAAIEVARVFYEAIADGLPVDLALTDARKAVCLAMPGSLEWGVPVLYTHTDDGVLFKLTAAAAPPTTHEEKRTEPTPRRRAPRERSVARERPRVPKVPIVVAAVVAAVALLAGAVAILRPSEHNNTIDLPRAHELWAGSRYLWATTNTDPGKVVRIDPRSRQHMPIAELRAGAKHLVETADRHLWVTTKDTVVELSGFGRHLLQTIPLVGQPNDLEPGGRESSLLFATNSADDLRGTIWRIDTSTNTATALTGVTKGLADLAVDGQTVWAAQNLGPNLYRVDATSGAAIGEPLPLGTALVAVLAYDKSIWVTDSAKNVVMRVDPKTGEVTRTIDVGHRPWGLAAGGGAMWVVNRGDATDRASTVSRIDPTTNQVTKMITVGAGADGVAWMDGALWVASNDAGQVTRITG
jgi:YVTN family beta-propeller protein